MASSLFILPPTGTIRDRCMPLGFLVAGSCFVRFGYDVRFLDLQLLANWQTVLGEALRSYKPQFIGVSACSFLDFAGVSDILTHLEENQVDLPVIIGGQHIRGPVIGLHIRSNVQMFGGYAEDMAGSQLTRGTRLPDMVSQERLGPLAMSHMPDITPYIPSIEVSRGCWNCCEFCSTDTPYAEKPVRLVTQELAAIASLFPKDTVLSLGGSNHRFSNWRKTGLLDVLKEFSDHFRFVMNVGVESGWEYLWDQLVELRPWHIYVGVESGSCDTLARMNKTRTPAAYVAMARSLIERCSMDGVYATATFIYGYPGDTEGDLEETDCFVADMASDYIVSCGQPCHAYPGTTILRRKRYYEDMGISFRTTPGYEDSFFYNLDIPSLAPYEALSERATRLFRMTNTNRRTYYRCRAYRHWVSFDDFLPNVSMYADCQ